MPKHVAIALFVAALIVVVVGGDLLFFKNRFWERLLYNVGIVMAFAAFGIRFFRQ